MARKNVSKREYQNSSGEKSVGPSADGRVLFALLGADGKPVETFDSSTLTEAARAMMAQFGFVTKVGNVANSVLNGDEPGTPDDAAADIREFLAGLALDPPQWREPGEGRARGPKYDKDVLAQVLYEGRSADKRTGEWADVATIRARLDDKSFYAKVRNNAGAMAAYYKAMAEKGADAQTASVDDLG